MIKRRVIELIEYKGIPKEYFYKKIGMTSASFRGDAKNSPLNSNAIENILSEIPDANPTWLLTGKGSMLKESGFTGSFNSEKDQYIMELQRKHIEHLETELDRLKKIIEQDPHYRIASGPDS